MQDSISFNGLLYGISKNHLTKPVLCCHHGDAKFIKLVNDSSGKSLEKFFDKNNFSFFEEDGVTFLRIKTKEIPNFNFFERLFYDVSSLQEKLIQKRKENVFTELVFKINKYEFEYLKDFYLFISKNQLELFKNFLLKHVKPVEKRLAEMFFES